jgi:hypothetical protein
MRELKTIQTKCKLNMVMAVDEKGNGGANHHYIITNLNQPDDIIAEILLQNGARKEEGSIRGIIDTDLLEICRDRLVDFQNGPFANKYNAEALIYVTKALESLNQRIEDREARNVLGKNIQ